MPDLWLNPAWRPQKRATIVLVHGAIVSGHELFLLRHRLTSLGYQTRLFQYQSMLKGLDENADLLGKFIQDTEGDVVHVVGHSMGGVLTRRLFEQKPEPRGGRLVAIGSPLRDCWTGRRFLGLHPYGRFLVGKTVLDHITRQNDPVWRGEQDLGVIAASYPFGVGRLFADLPEPNDGVVLQEETWLEGLRDHVTYRVNHFGTLLSRRCTMQVASFLATGAFTPDATSDPAMTGDFFATRCVEH